MIALIMSLICAALALITLALVIRDARRQRDYVPIDFVTGIYDESDEDDWS